VFAIPDRRRVTWLAIGAIGWSGLAWIGGLLASADPPRLGDDLRLLVGAARRITENEPLYAQVGAGGWLVAEGLFYSYPPLVAQALVPAVGLPFGTFMLLWSAGAVAGLGLAARRLSRPGCELLLPTLALAPYTAAFAVALLFGNVNAWFPLVLGFVLAGLLAPGPVTTAAAGAAIAAATIAKLHPASVGLWLVVRAIRLRRARPELAMAGVAAVAGLLAVVSSVVAGGTRPWVEYFDFLRFGAAASDIVSPLNVGPASQLAIAFGLDEAAARSMQIAVTAAAMAVTVLAAWRLEDHVASLAWATAASLVVLPVTWLHYSVALIPVALASMARAEGASFRPVGALIGGALAATSVAVAVPILMWVAVALVLWSAHRSASGSAGRPVAHGDASGSRPPDGAPRLR
jgi:hypothetical protein